MPLSLKIKDHESRLIQDFIRHDQYKHLQTESYHSYTCFLSGHLVFSKMQRMSQHKLAEFYQMFCDTFSKTRL